MIMLLSEEFVSIVQLLLEDMSCDPSRDLFPSESEVALEEGLRQKFGLPDFDDEPRYVGILSVEITKEEQELLTRLAVSKKEVIERYNAVSHELDLLINRLT